MSTPLNGCVRKAIIEYTGGLRPVDGWERLGELFRTAGNAVLLARARQDDYYLMHLGLLCTGWLVYYLGWDGGAVTTAVEHEYRRAHSKHEGLTPYSDEVTDSMREAILLEEVGEVARACTPDAHTDVGHAGDLADELIQVITMAAAWGARIAEIQEADQ